MSCRMMSIDEFASTIPVNPPMVNKNTNPRAHIKGASKEKCAP